MIVLLIPALEPGQHLLDLLEALKGPFLHGFAHRVCRGHRRIYIDIKTGRAAGARTDGDYGRYGVCADCVSDRQLSDQL